MADYGLVSQALEGLGRSLAGVGEQKARNILAKSEADRSAAQFELTKAQGMGQLEIAKSQALLAERTSANEHELKLAEAARTKRGREIVPLTQAIMESNMDPTMKERIRPFLETIDPDLGIAYGAVVGERDKIAEMFGKLLDYRQQGMLKRETLAQAAAKAEADRAEKEEGRKMVSADRRYAADLAAQTSAGNAALSAQTSRSNAQLLADVKRTAQEGKARPTTLIRERDKRGRVTQEYLVYNDTGERVGTAAKSTATATASDGKKGPAMSIAQAVKVGRYDVLEETLRSAAPKDKPQIAAIIKQIGGEQAVQALRKRMTGK